MHTLWIFFGDQLHEAYFPDLHTWTTQILIDATQSGLQMDIVFPVRALDNRVFITPPNGFIWGDNKSSAERQVNVEQLYTFTRDSIRFILQVKNLSRSSLSFRKYMLRSGRLAIGRGESCDIIDPHPTIGTSQGFFTLRDNQVAEYTDQSTNGTYLNGHKVLKSTVSVQFGDILMFTSGLKLVFMGNIIAINHTDLLRKVGLQPLPNLQPLSQPEEDRELPSLYVQYHRAPRMVTQPDAIDMEIEPPIPKQTQNMPPAWQQIGPSMTMILPMGVSTMVMVATSSGRSSVPTGLIMIGTSSLLAVMWGILNRRYTRRQLAENETARINLYRQYIEETENTLRDLNNRELLRLNGSFPSVGECVSLPTDGSHRLWNRMPTHADFLHVRLGIGTVPLPANISIQKQKLTIINDPLRDEPTRLKNTYSIVQNAPVTVNLRREAVVGILGTDMAALFAQGLMMQICAMHSYHDVRVAVLMDVEDSTEWAWARWLPHAFASEDREMRMVASSASAIHEIITHLSDVLKMRRTLQKDRHQDENSGEDFDETTLPLPHYVIFCTNPALLENEPITRQLLTSRLGTTLVVVAPSMEMLPKECRLIFNVASKPGMLHTASGETSQVDYEYPNHNLLYSFSRNIAPLRVKDAAENAAIPTLVSFLDVCNVRRAEDLDVWRMWSENHTYEGICSTIGYAAGSHPFVLNISDKYHGPHGLIAGTTGSGKSVMLQTYILSLLLNYSPQQVQFILIDYKGGGMAGPFLDLPHTAGVIDNLQGPRTISRALASLNGEIHRRERIFKAHDVSSIDDYTQLFDSDPNEVKLPHLIIIVDEFAELKSEQPDFMRELVSASRVGRSLGIHLILATQKPSNSVSDEIWANSRFHLCLRVQTPSDSNEMLKRPDAAYIKGMGRCFIQIGNDELFEQVQTSYAGLTYNPNEPRAEEMPHLLNENGQVVRLPKRRKTSEDKRSETTQMDAVLARIKAVAAEHGLDRSKPMWLPEMPSQIYFGDMQIYKDHMSRDGRYVNSPENITLLLGLADDVATQRYVPCLVDLTENRNLMIVGVAGTGKTTAIQSMVTSLCSRYDPAHLNIYILSLTSQTLKVMSEFPQIGDILFENETIEIQRFINMLYDMSQRRAKMFSLASTDSFIEYNRGQREASLPEEPAVVVFVDRFEQLKAMFANSDFYTARIQALIQEASSRGIHFVVTALVKNEISPRLHSFFGGIALQLRDRSDYSDVLGKRVPFDRPPIAGYPGRCMVIFGEEKEIFEAQIGLGGIMPEAFEQEAPFIAENPDIYTLDHKLSERAPLTDSTRSDSIVQYASQLRANWHGAMPPRVPRVPAKPRFEELIAMPDFDTLLHSPFMLPIGYDMNSGSVAAINLETDYSMLVTGLRKSGVTNALKTIVRVLRMQNATVYVIGGNDWVNLCKDTGAELFQSEDEIIAFIDRFVEEVPRQRKPLKDATASLGRAALRKMALGFDRRAIIVDGLERFTKGFTAERFTKSPVELENAARSTAAQSATEENPSPAYKTASELAPGQDPKRTTNAKTWINAVLGQMSSIADYYNISLFMGMTQIERSILTQEPVNRLLAQGRGIELGGHLNDYDPINISQAVSGWPVQERQRGLLPGNGYMLTSAGMMNIRIPLSEVEEDEEET